MTAANSPVLVIGGSVRPNRVCLQIAAWVAALGAEVLAEALEMIDLKDWPLPMDDEPAIPATGRYSHEHTLAWSGKVGGARAVVLVSPQYNLGYPAALKNALDHLYKEWADKPVMIVTYGARGGDRCSDQLLQVVTGLHMKPVEPRPQLRLPRPVIEADAGQIDPAALFADHAEEIRRGFRSLASALRA